MRQPAAVLIALVLGLAAACDGGAEGEPDEDPSEPPPAADDADEPDPPAEEDPQPDDDEPVAVTATIVASGLDVPWDVAFTDDDRVFVTERDTGVLSELHDDGQRRQVATFPIDATGEGGLLGVTASPDFADDDTLFVYYTSAEDNRVVRLVGDEDPEPVVTGIPKAGNHNGGRVEFGPDGVLYIGTGDAGQADLAQDPESLAGKILRVTRDGDVPDDNPEGDSPVYALGLRNVQGLAWDADGQLYATELGPDVDDAIYRVQAGANYGWPHITASQPGGEEFAGPVDVRQPEEASWSGAAFLVDGAIPQWEGNLFAAGLRGQRLWRYELAGDGQVADVEQLLVQEHGRLRHVTQAPDGSLWVLTSNLDGRGDPDPDDDRILRLGPAG